MAEFEHIISTRFNVPTERWITTSEGKMALTGEWLKDRFDIFEKYCFPSFKNQTLKDFIWLVFFDIETPEIYKNRINQYQIELGNFKPIFVRDFEEMREKLISETRKSASPFIISSDIDNDDWLHKDFVLHTQKLFSPLHNLVIELRRGYQLTKISEKKAVINELYAVANPFLSLVEKKETAETVIKKRHPEFRHYQDHAIYDCAPMFVQFIHDNNLINATINTKRLPSMNFEDFGINMENRFYISKVQSLIYNIRRISVLFKKIIFR